MINIQNTDDNEYFKYCLVKYLILANPDPAKITKSDKDFAKRLNLKDIKFPVISIDSKKKGSIGTSVFGHENRENIKCMYEKML